MTIPKLEKSTRDREYKRYLQSERRDVVVAYLFDGLSHRDIDTQVLGLDSTYSRGYQSMGILHYLGITGSFKGLFKGMDVNNAAEILEHNGESYYDLAVLLKEVGISERQCEDDIQSETATEYTVSTEGREKHIYTTIYERKASLRKAAIQIHGTTCMACGFNYESVYGPRGRDYIEVHHIKPLSSLNEQVEVNPATDLIVVCANCHRIIHRIKSEVLMLDDLRELIRTHKDDSSR